MDKIKEIIRLGEQHNLSNRAIARALHISRPAVGQYLNDFKATGLKYVQIKDKSDEEFLALLDRKKRIHAPRYEALLSKFNDYLKELKRTGVNLQVLWEEASGKTPGATLIPSSVITSKSGVRLLSSRCILNISPGISCLSILPEKS